MVTTWGAESGYHSVGIDLSYSGTTVTVTYYVRSSATSVADNQTLTLTGTVTGTVNFYMGTANSVPVKVATKTFSASRGTDFTVGARLSGVYNGATPSHSRSGTVPTLVPSTPSITAIKSVTGNSAVVELSAASPNGSTVDEYQVQAADSSSFSNELDAPRGSSRSLTLTGLPSATKVYIRGRAHNSIGWSGWSTAKRFTTLSTPPAAPGTPSVSRVSDTQHTLEWVRNSHSGAPYESQKVERSTNGGAWVTIASLSGSATSFTDSTTAPDNRYSWRVVAENTGGATSSSSSVAFQTTPAAPSIFTAVKTAEANIDLAWVTNSKLASITFAVEESTNNGGAWAPLTSTSLTSYTHLAPSIVLPHLYRVRAVSTVGASTSSAWALSNAIILAAPPAAPTLVAPVAAVDADRGIVLQWRHNPVDTSPQSFFALRYRAQGAPSWTTVAKTDGAQSSYTVPAGYANGQTIEWQAQTWGDHADPSPWSPLGVFVLSSTPLVTITAPLPVHGLSELTIEWEYFHSGGSVQAQWQAELVDSDSQVVEAVTGARETTYKCRTFFQNDSSWTVRLRARSGAGLWSDWAEQPFTVEYAKPPIPIVSTAWDRETGTIEIEIENPEPGPTETDAEYSDVYRRINGGEWLKIGHQVPLQGTILDRLPTVAGLNEYRVVSHSGLPSSAEAENVQVTIAEPGWCYANSGPGFGDLRKIWGNMKLGGTIKRDKALHKYAGRRRRIVTFGETVDLTVTVSGRVTPDASTLYEWEDLESAGEMICWRDPKGRRIFGVIDGVGHNHTHPYLNEISFSVEEIDYAEPAAQ